MAFSKKRSMVSCVYVQGKWGGEYNAAAGGFIQKNLWINMAPSRDGSRQ